MAETSRSPPMAWVITSWPAAVAAAAMALSVGQASVASMPRFFRPSSSSSTWRGPPYRCRPVSKWSVFKKGTGP